MLSFSQSLQQLKLEAMHKLHLEISRAIMHEKTYGEAETHSLDDLTSVLLFKPHGESSLLKFAIEHKRLEYFIHFIKHHYKNQPIPPMLFDHEQNMSLIEAVFCYGNEDSLLCLLTTIPYHNVLSPWIYLSQLDSRQLLREANLTTILQSFSYLDELRQSSKTMALGYPKSSCDMMIHLLNLHRQMLPQINLDHFPMALLSAYVKNLCDDEQEDEVIPAMLDQIALTRPKAGFEQTTFFQWVESFLITFLAINYPSNKVELRFVAEAHFLTWFVDAAIYLIVDDMEPILIAIGEYDGIGHDRTAGKDEKRDKNLKRILQKKSPEGIDVQIYRHDVLKKDDPINFIYNLIDLIDKSLKTVISLKNKNLAVEVSAAVQSVQVEPISSEEASVDNTNPLRDLIIIRSSANQELPEGFTGLEKEYLKAHFKSLYLKIDTPPLLESQDLLNDFYCLFGYLNTYNPSGSTFIKLWVLCLCFKLNDRMKQIELTTEDIQAALTILRSIQLDTKGLWFFNKLELIKLEKYLFAKMTAFQLSYKHISSEDFETSVLSSIFNVSNGQSLVYEQAVNSSNLIMDQLMADLEKKQGHSVFYQLLTEADVNLLLEMGSYARSYLESWIEEKSVILAEMQAIVRQSLDYYIQDNRPTLMLEQWAAIHHIKLKIITHPETNTSSLELSNDEQVMQIRLPIQDEKNGLVIQVYEQAQAVQNSIKPEDKKKKIHSSNIKKIDLSVVEISCECSDEQFEKIVQQLDADVKTFCVKDDVIESLKEIRNLLQESNDALVVLDKKLSGLTDIQDAKKRPLKKDIEDVKREISTSVSLRDSFLECHYFMMGKKNKLPDRFSGRLLTKLKQKKAQAIDREERNKIAILNQLQQLTQTQIEQLLLNKYIIIKDNKNCDIELRIIGSNSSKVFEAIKDKLVNKANELDLQKRYFSLINQHIEYLIKVKSNERDLNKWQELLKKIPLSLKDKFSCISDLRNSSILFKFVDLSQLLTYKKQKLDESIKEIIATGNTQLIVALIELFSENKNDELLRNINWDIFYCTLLFVFEIYPLDFEACSSLFKLGKYAPTELRTLISVILYKNNTEVIDAFFQALKVKEISGKKWSGFINLLNYCTQILNKIIDYIKTLDKDRIDKYINILLWELEYFVVDYSFSGFMLALKNSPDGMYNLISFIFKTNNPSWINRIFQLLRQKSTHINKLHSGFMFLLINCDSGFTPFIDYLDSSEVNPTDLYNYLNLILDEFAYVNLEKNTGFRLALQYAKAEIPTLIRIIHRTNNSELRSKLFNIFKHCDRESDQNWSDFMAFIYESPEGFAELVDFIDALPRDQVEFDQYIDLILDELIYVSRIKRTGFMYAAEHARVPLEKLVNIIIDTENHKKLNKLFLAFHRPDLTFEQHWTGFMSLGYFCPGAFINLIEYINRLDRDQAYFSYYMDILSEALDYRNSKGGSLLIFTAQYAPKGLENLVRIIINTNNREWIARIFNTLKHTMNLAAILRFSTEVFIILLDYLNSLDPKKADFAKYIDTIFNGFELDKSDVFISLLQPHKNTNIAFNSFIDLILKTNNQSWIRRLFNLLEIKNGKGLKWSNLMFILYTCPEGFGSIVAYLESLDQNQPCFADYMNLILRELSFKDTKSCTAFMLGIECSTNELNYFIGLVLETHNVEWINLLFHALKQQMHLGTNLSGFMVAMRYCPHFLSLFLNFLESPYLKHSDLLHYIDQFLEILACQNDAGWSAFLIASRLAKEDMHRLIEIILNPDHSADYDRHRNALLQLLLEPLQGRYKTSFVSLFIKAADTCIHLLKIVNQESYPPVSYVLFLIKITDYLINEKWSPGASVLTHFINESPGLIRQLGECLDTVLKKHPNLFDKDTHSWVETIQRCARQLSYSTYSNDAHFLFFKKSQHSINQLEFDSEYLASRT